ncbi:DUF3784 domain-containing protein [Acholeplasma sp. OttesenSCG-928-E16]|nr:DUF3784 domain-containing protein [Acholeplasma sp. OttesenSCG-928-E16]
MVIMLIVTIILMVVFIALAVLFYFGKGAMLIAGFNTMSEEEKKKINVKALTRFMSLLMVIQVFALIFWLLFSIFEIQPLLWVGIGIMLVSLLFGIIYVNKSKRFKNQEE